MSICQFICDKVVAPCAKVAWHILTVLNKNEKLVCYLLIIINISHTALTIQ